MLSFIARYFSSLWELITYPIRAIWHVITKIFPTRDCTVMNTQDGNVYTYQQTSFWRFTKFCVIVTMTIWASWSTYVFVYHRPMLQKRTQQLDMLKEKHNRHMADLKIYLQKYNDLARDLNITDDKILKADKDKLSDTEKEKLLNTKSKISGELDFLHSRIVDMMTDAEYRVEFEKMSDIAAEIELIRNENKNLVQRNELLAQSMLEIEDADSQIVAQVTELTDTNSSELHSNLKKISSTINKLGLSEAKLVQQANKYSNKFVGDIYTPINIDKKADAKYKKIAQDLEQWHGLKRLTEILPLGIPVEKKRITSNYGTRPDPFTHKEKQHKGIDFAGKIGTELYAVAPGRVISSGDRFNYGTTVEIDHGLGFTTLYAHLSKPMVSRGDWVRPGTVVGLAGSSGRSTGPHLHYEIRYKGTPFNPVNFIKE